MFRKSRSSFSAAKSGLGKRGSRADEDDSFESSSSSSPVQSSSQSFDASTEEENGDPFESFDAHDRAAGHHTYSRSSERRAGFSRSGSSRADSGYSRSSQSRSSQPDSTPSDTVSEITEATEATYSRSRRVPGEPKPVDPDAAQSSKRPARSLKGRALGYLSRREYSRAELARKLAPYVEETDNLDALLDVLETENWLSDTRFAESLLHRRSGRLGASRIVGELKRHALGQTLIEEASAQLRETELPRALAVWQKKFGKLPETQQERARQARFLASRGFSGATIGKILKGIDEDFVDG
ncbi:recombination regulator RecX [Paraburkholderia sp.]|uniref:recombination regulator RecX n=1 Tax=Paraburkholderia sp. TaxID=1926495 RepID=UPI0023A650D5|nr:recombination regulator RecX [Paraburkholderia sp.]MDE1179529.1 recombination regulator RecX [Paraburkholderia sp.]